MKGSFVPLAFLSLVLCACSPAAPASPSPTSSVTPSSTSTPTPSPTPTPIPAPSPTPTTTTNAACNEIAFYLDPALGTGYTCETVPANTSPQDPHPNMTRITLMGYSVSGSFLNPQVFVMPVSDYIALDPTRISAVLSDLQGLLSSSTPPVFGVSGPNLMPIFPLGGGIPSLFSNFAAFPFSDGDGVRFISERRFDVTPISDDGTFYTYQGLTTDGLYIVSAVLPIDNPVIADDGSLPAGMTYDQFATGFNAYVQDLVNQLNAQPPGTFTPLIADLDALVASITITP